MFFNKYQYNLNIRIKGIKKSDIPQNNNELFSLERLIFIKS